VTAHAKLAVILAPTAALALLAPLAGQSLAPRESLEELTTAARRDSNDAAAQYLLGLGFWNKQRYDDAERVFRLAVAIEPRFAPGWLALGVLPFARRPKLREEQMKGHVPEDWKETLAESERSIRRAFLVDPLVDLRILSSVDRARRWAVRVVNGRLYISQDPFAFLEQGQYRLAFDLFDADMPSQRDSVTLSSVPSPLLWYHGICAAHLNLYTIAIHDFQSLLDRALARERSDSLLRMPLATNDYRYLLALMYQREADWLDAVPLYRAALENDLGLYMAHLQLARIFAARGMLDSAVIESRAAVVVNPEDPSLLLEHGAVLMAAGQFTAAEDTLRRSMEANSRESQAPYFLGVTLQAMNRPNEARDAFERFLSLAPSRLTEKIAEAKRRLAMLQ